MLTTFWLEASWCQIIFLLLGQKFCEWNGAEQLALYSPLGGFVYANNQTRPHKLTSPHEQMTFIRLKQTIYDKFVQVRQFGECSCMVSMKRDMHTCEQRVCMLLIILCMQRSIACRLEDIVEKLTASLTVLHWVLTLHHHQQRNQVWHSYWTMDYRVYRKIWAHRTHKTLRQDCNTFKNWTVLYI